MHQKLMLWYGRHKLLSWILAGLVITYLLVGYIGVPLLVHHLLNHQVSESLNRQVTAASVRANPFAMALRLDNLSIAGHNNEPFIEAEEIYVNVSPIASLLKWGLVIQSLEIDALQGHLIRTRSDQFNFSDLMRSSTKKQPAGDTEPSKPIRMVFKTFELSHGRITLKDLVPSEPFETSLHDLHVKVRGLDTHPEAAATQFELSVRTEAYEAVEIDGSAGLHPPSAEADLRVNGFKLAKYAPYYIPFLNIKQLDGEAGLNATLIWSDQMQAIRDILFTLTDLKLQSDQSDPLVAIPRFEVTGAEIDLKAKAIQLGRVHTRDGAIHLQRDPKGRLNVAAVLPKKAPPPAGQKQTLPSTGQTTETPWEVKVPELILEGYTVRFKDQQPQPAADIKVSRINLNMKDLSTRNNTTGTADLALQWADQGDMTMQGDLGLMPFQAKLNVEAKAMDIRPLQPYINEAMQLVVTKGRFDTKGLMTITPQGTAMDIRFSGQASLNEFQSVDPEKADEFLKWKSLFVNGLDLDVSPFRLAVNEVALTDFYNRLIINADGTSNLAMIMVDSAKAPSSPSSTKKNPSGATPPSSKGAPSAKQANDSDIKIKTVILQGGNIDFTDRLVDPNVRLNMTKIGGRISGLDAIKTHTADVFLKGMVRGNVPMEIKGQINPLIDQPFADITIGLNAVDLSPLTPYSGKYLGYQLRKGQLSLNLSYRVEENKLDAKNKVLLSQLTLGEPVESPQATKLPIKLALALLKDRQGNIDIDLPVTGDLDDPEFSIGGIVMKMVVNLIVEIVSSPFKLLGALFGGGEELAYLDFDAGRNDIGPERIANLEKLSKILYERPGLNLEIQGEVAPEADVDALRQQRFEDQLKAAKLKTMMARGQKAVPLEQIQLSPKERTKLVKKAYKAAQFPKPRDEKGKLKALSPLEMEKLLYTAIEITASDLSHLAHQRALAAKEYLTHTGNVAVERLFIVEPNIKEGDSKEAPQSRVKFTFI